jgi:hypothetical protein
MQFHRIGNIPRHYSSDVTYLIHSRKTIYCVHSDMGLSTKTCVVGFRQKQHAESMRAYLSMHQRDGKIVDGVVSIEGKLPLLTLSQARPILPLELKSSTLEKVERECLLNFFDLWLVHDLRPAKKRMHLDIYEYITTEPPHRSLLNHQMEGLLRRS